MHTIKSYLKRDNALPVSIVSFHNTQEIHIYQFPDGIPYRIYWPMCALSSLFPFAHSSRTRITSDESIDQVYGPSQVQVKETECN